MTTIPVTIEINSDELRKWADKHADAGNHGVAHVLYQAAKGVDSVSEQAIREAKAEALREAVSAADAGRRSPKPETSWRKYLLDRADAIERGE